MFQLSPLVVSPEILVAKGGTMWTRNCRWILPEMPDFHVAFRDLSHAVNLRHGTDGFTSPPKEGGLRNFSPWKIRRLRPGLNPRTLPLDHRLRCPKSSLKYSLFLSDLNKIVKHQILWKSVQSKPNCFIQTDGRTDRHDEANSSFSQFCERS
jgi:hypothetical protein